MARPRVLVLTPDFPPGAGGIQQLIHRVISYWNGLEVVVVTLGPKGVTTPREPTTLATVRVREGPLGHRFDVGRLNARALALSLRWRPDVVLSAHVVMAPAAMLIRTLSGTPYVQYLHGLEIATRRRLATRALARARGVIAVSQFTADAARSLHPRLRLEVIPPGVDVPDTASIDRPRTGAPTIVTVSRLAEHYKGHDVLLRALPLIAARVPDVRWTVVGDGPLRRQYEETATALGIRDRVAFVGAVDDAQRDQILASAAVFAMVSRSAPSGGGEGFGIVYLEAGAHGLPVLAGRFGGALDAVRHGDTGMLVDPEDHIAVAAGLSDLLTNRERARRMGNAGRHHAEIHAWPDISARVEKLLLDVAAQGARRSARAHTGA